MLDDASLDQLLRRARSTHRFSPRPVTDETVRQLYELLKWGPTAFNAQPGRYVFVRSAAAKARLAPALASTNRAKTLAAPATVIVAYDTQFFERIPELSPGSTGKDLLATDVSLAESTAFRNGSLQGAYLILAARALGLAAGPMSGFNSQMVNDEFFARATWRANFLVNIGYGAEGAVKREPLESNSRMPCKFCERRASTHRLSHAPAIGRTVRR